VVPASIRRWESVLVDRVAAGDDSALATIYDQFGALVYGIACRIAGAGAASDLTQEVFEILWDHPDQFVGDHCTLRTRLATLTRHHARETIRTRRCTSNAGFQHPDGWLDAPLGPAPNIDEAAHALFAAERVRVALELLPPHQRESVELVHVEGLTFHELAVRTGTSEASATSRVRLGLDRLARELRERGSVGRT
jgi:RNA polymerase sigma-70 factor (ECF subfamily)